MTKEDKNRSIDLLPDVIDCSMLQYHDMGAGWQDVNQITVKGDFVIEFTLEDGSKKTFTPPKEFHL